jgi:hypothetical protein
MGSSGEDPVITLARAQKPATADAASIHFTRDELNRVLALYFARVATGEWRDYAVGQQPGRAIFAVYRHTLEHPLFTIAKLENGRWEIANGARRVLTANSLADTLAVFSRGPRLVEPRHRGENAPVPSSNF